MSALLPLLREMIAEGGPMSVGRYMSLALAHPQHGYYATRDPLGRDGDFTTAPEISQMFGELVGLWAAAVWIEMGQPSPVRLVELGPGRGTMMSDALRAVRIVPGFLEAVGVYLVETSPVLRGSQRDTLAGAGVPVAWCESLGQVPAGPSIVLANEFFDALPIRQFLRIGGAWRERLVGLDGRGDLAFGLAAGGEPGLAGVPGRDGDVIEVADAAADVMRRVAAGLAAHGGAALVIDYGHVPYGFGDTLQAVRRHAVADPLAAPGEADLTAHVDFAALGRAAAGAGAAVFGPVEQGAFLRDLGIQARADRLKAGLDPNGRAAVDAALLRLTGPGPAGMGRLFKIMGVAHPGLAELPGLPGRASEPARPAPA